ncbi:hypothetical protein G9A89_019404 [Geosiphon pyriformis]|nr:hypothetical protein G9A89_019404 [Geosiphon pyriformis]
MNNLNRKRPIENVEPSGPSSSPLPSLDRKRQKKDLVWPPHIEEALIEALSNVPRIGRNKVNHGGKLCGELKADFVPNSDLKKGMEELALLTEIPSIDIPDSQTYIGSCSSAAPTSKSTAPFFFEVLTPESFQEKKDGWGCRQRMSGVVDVDTTQDQPIIFPASCDTLATGFNLATQVVAENAIFALDEYFDHRISVGDPETSGEEVIFGFDLEASSIDDISGSQVQPPNDILFAYDLVATPISHLSEEAKSESSLGCSSMTYNDNEFGLLELDSLLNGKPVPISASTEPCDLFDQEYVQEFRLEEILTSLGAPPIDLGTSLSNSLYNIS